MACGIGWHVVSRLADQGRMGQLKEMSKEHLTKEEWVRFLKNDWYHLNLDVAGIKIDIKWIKWFLCLLVAGVIAYIIKDFLVGV